MTRDRHRLEVLGVVVYAIVDWLVIMAPVLAIELAADRGGIGDTEGLDLLIASAAIATPHAFVAARRLRDEERIAVRGADVWIASLDALVVLALSTTLLVVVVLASFPDEHAACVAQAWVPANTSPDEQPGDLRVGGFMRDFAHTGEWGHVIRQEGCKP